MGEALEVLMRKYQGQWLVSTPGYDDKRHTVISCQGEITSATAEVDLSGKLGGVLSPLSV